jgi:glutathione synthase/RimK-type ligase-like ATP-grasp enzyme
VSKKTILLLSTEDKAPEYSDRLSVLLRIAETFRSENTRVDKARIEDLAFSIVGGKPKIEIIESDRAILESGYKDLAQYDLVYVKNWKAHADLASAIAIYLKAHGVRILCEELNHFRVVDKSSESFMLALNDIPYPDTLFCAHSRDLFNVWQRYSDSFSMPLVIKALDGSAGDNNYLAKNEAELLDIINNYPDIKFMIQNLIPNDSDYRVITLDFEPALVFQRKRKDNSTHLNNTSQGAKAELLEIDSLPQSVLDDCRKSARLVRREIAGVDIMFNSETGRHVVLEINASPQLATGAFLEEKKKVLKKYFGDIFNIDVNDKK